MGWEEEELRELGRWGVVPFLLKQDQHFEIKAERNASLISGNQTVLIIYVSRFLLGTSALT